MSDISVFLARKTKKVRQVGTPGQQDITRICKLPVASHFSDKEYRKYCRDNSIASAWNDGFRFFPIQAEAMKTFEEEKALFGPIGVGHGKTLLTLSCASKAYQDGWSKRTIIMVPAHVYGQLVKQDIPWARKRIYLGLPFFYMGEKSASARRAIAQSKQDGCYVLPYSMLSTKEGEEYLYMIDPDLLILDEVHAIKNRKAARTRRIMHFLDSREKDEAPVHLVGLSGTITSKSIEDYAHIIKKCLGDKNPLPNLGSTLYLWKATLDVNADPGREEEWAFNPISNWARHNIKSPEKPITPDISGFREAFKHRLVTAPGVVATGDHDIGTSISLQNIPVPFDLDVEGRAELESLRKKVEDTWMTPCGDEIEHAIHMWKWLYELSAGFFNQLLWPEEEDLAKRRGIPVSAASTLLEKAKEHHDALQDYHRALRSWLRDYARQGLDTPLLVALEMSKRGGVQVGDELFDLWATTKELEFEGMPERESSAVRVCPFKVDALVSWAQGLNGKGALVWVYHQEMLLWAVEALREAGLPVIACPAGRVGNERVLDHKNKKRILVCSITGHGTGKNLQHFQHQYYLQWPRSAVVAEQSLGRTHRMGQQADELVVHTNQSTEFDRMNFAACLNDSLYIHQSTGNKQKLIYCDYSPLPTIFPSSVLDERGFQNKKLSGQQSKEMEEIFGT